MFLVRSIFIVQWVFTAVFTVYFQFNAKAPLCSSPRVLEGGYSKWHLTYAVTCTGKYTRKKPTVSSAEGQGSELSNGMDYPAFPKLE